MAHSRSNPVTTTFARISLICLALACALSRPVFAQDALTPETAAALKSVTDVAIDPAGRRVAYVLSVPRAEDDDHGGPYSEIWIANLTGDNARRYTRSKANASSPRWSPDGTRLAFLSKRSEHGDNTQILTLPTDGGEADPLTDHDTSISAFRWSPSGRWIAFTAADPQSDNEKADAEAGRDWTVVDQAPKHIRLWILDTESRLEQKAYETDLSAGSFVWTPDGAALIMQAAPTPRTDDGMLYRSIYGVPREGGEPALICETRGKLGPMSVSPDGSQLAFLGATALNDPLPQSLFVVNLPKAAARNLTEGFDGSSQHFDWIDDRALLLLAAKGTRTGLLRVDARSGKLGNFVDLGPILSTFDLHQPSGRLAAIAHAPDHPAEVYLASLETTELRRVTKHNPQLESLRLAKQEVIEWQGPDDLRIEGIPTYPLDHDTAETYPLIVHPHGGPEGASQDGWNAFPQMIAARGYFVLQPNYRGSGGRGVAFSKGDHNDLGGKEFHDIIAGISALVEKGLVDPERVGIAGWSYGGYLSALAATHHSDRFKAAVMGAGISNWVSFMGTTDITHEMSIVHWNQWWQDDPGMYWRRSPLSKIDDAQTPTLILHGKNDVRVHPGQAMEMYLALKRQGVPTELVFYPRATHGISERVHRIDMYQRQLDWFDRYLR